MPQFRTPYELQPSVGLSFNLPSKTQQQFKDECDLEQLLKRHNIYDLIGLANSGGREPLYADVSEVPDFAESQNHLRRATEYFEGLPSDIRSKFNNSLSEFLTVLNSGNAVKELQELGILKKEAEPVKTEPVQPVMPGKDVVEPSPAKTETTATEVKTS